MRIGCLGVQPGSDDDLDQDAIRARHNNALGPFLNERDRLACSRPVKHAKAAGRGGYLPQGFADHRDCLRHCWAPGGLADLLSEAMRCSEQGLPQGQDDACNREFSRGSCEALESNWPWSSNPQGDPEAAVAVRACGRRSAPAHHFRALAKRGFIAGQKLVGRLLKRLNLQRLRANCETREGANHALIHQRFQFEHINAKMKAFQAAGQPVISVDTKKEELVGDFKKWGSWLRMIQNSLKTEGLLIEILRRRTPSTPAPIFCFPAHISRVRGLRGIWVSGGEAEGLHFVGVLSFGDEFREVWSSGEYPREIRGGSGVVRWRRRARRAGCRGEWFAARSRKSSRRAGDGQRRGTEAVPGR